VTDAHRTSLAPFLAHLLRLAAVESAGVAAGVTSGGGGGRPGSGGGGHSGGWEALRGTPAGGGRAGGWDALRTLAGALAPLDAAQRAGAAGAAVVVSVGGHGKVASSRGDVLADVVDDEEAVLGVLERVLLPALGPADAEAGGGAPGDVAVLQRLVARVRARVR
jgi:hypothetical protein